MVTQPPSHAASLQGRHVSVALRSGRRLDDCQLISAGGRGGEELWVFTNGQDVFFPMTDVLDVWESPCPGGSRWGLGQLIGIDEWRSLR